MNILQVEIRICWGRGKTPRGHRAGSWRVPAVRWGPLQLSPAARRCHSCPVLKRPRANLSDRPPGLPGALLLAPLHGSLPRGHREVPSTERWQGEGFVFRGAKYPGFPGTSCAPHSITSSIPNHSGTGGLRQRLETALLSNFQEDCMQLVSSPRWKGTEG